MPFRTVNFRPKLSMTVTVGLPSSNNIFRQHLLAIPAELVVDEYFKRPASQGAAILLGRSQKNRCFGMKESICWCLSTLGEHLQARIVASDSIAHVPSGSIIFGSVRR